jgi:diguanylate cyclase (GGDEF)-like protein
MKIAEHELQLSNESENPFSLLMLDLDHFKGINDKYGHSIGDEVLKIFTKRTQRVLRSDSLIARYGGEEFIVMLKDAGAENAIMTAWRIQKAIESSKFTLDGNEVDVTVSIGVASNSSYDVGLSDMIESADAALYRAKNSGRNTVSA